MSEELFNAGDVVDHRGSHKIATGRVVLYYEVVDGICPEWVPDYELARVSQSDERVDYALLTRRVKDVAGSTKARLEHTLETACGLERLAEAMEQCKARHDTQ